MTSCFVAVVATYMLYCTVLCLYFFVLTFLSSARLVVGWCWEEVVVGAVSLIFADKEGQAFNWIRALIKVAVAIVAFLLGREVERRTRILTGSKLEALRESMIEKVGNEKANDGVQLGPLSTCTAPEVSVNPIVSDNASASTY